MKQTSPGNSIISKSQFFLSKYPKPRFLFYDGSDVQRAKISQANQTRENLDREQCISHINSILSAALSIRWLHLHCARGVGSCS